MITRRTLRPTVHIPSRHAAAARRALKIWLATGSVPVAYIVAEPDVTEDMTMEEAIAA
jgi:hypothetical protein